MSLPGTGATFKPGGTASLPANVSLSELSMEAKMLELQLREAKGKAARKKKKAGGYLMEEREAGGPNTAELIAADSVHAHKNRLSANLDSAIYGNGAVGRQVPGSMMPRSPDDFLSVGSKLGTLVGPAGTQRPFVVPMGRSIHGLAPGSLQPAEEPANKVDFALVITKSQRNHFKVPMAD